jgi:hypothetical protein
MGGGVTRSFGSLFMLCSLWWVFRLFRDGGRLELVLSILFCSLTVLSHPEVAIHTAAGCVLLWLYYGRTRRSALSALLVGIGTVLLSAPWWGQVLYMHGSAPFLSALNTGYHNTSWQALFSALTANQTVVPILLTARMAGIFWGIWKKEYFLVLWFILPYLVEPRSAPSIAFYPFCMLMAFAFTDALPALVDRLMKMDPLSPRTAFHERGWLNITLLLVMVYLFAESGLYGFKLINTSLSAADREAMSWIRDNTPAQSRFLPITGVRSPEIDPFVEWFPALTERRSQTTIQGYEWLLGKGFYERYGAFAEVQGCKTAGCFAAWSARTGLDYQYLVIQTAGVDEGLVAALSQAGGVEVVYVSDEVLIYAVRGINW